MNRKNFIAFLALAMFALVGNAAGNQAALQVDGILPALRVEGKNLVDANGKIVVLHGVMDTPNRYFNGWRWQQWKADYSESDIQPCLEYFSKQFSAITDKEQGAYCTVFRLHMDPCWTNNSFIYNEALKPIPTVMQQISAAGIARAGVAAAAAVITMLPPIIVFIFCQSSVMETMATSGLKD